MTIDDLKVLAQTIPPGNWNGLIAYTDFGVGLGDAGINEELGDDAERAVAIFAALAPRIIALVEAANDDDGIEYHAPAIYDAAQAFNAALEAL